MTNQSETQMEGVEAPVTERIEIEATETQGLPDTLNGLLDMWEEDSISVRVWVEDNLGANPKSSDNIILGAAALTIDKDVDFTSFNEDLKNRGLEQCVKGRAVNSARGVVGLETPSKPSTKTSKTPKKKGKGKKSTTSSSATDAVSILEARLAAFREDRDIVDANIADVESALAAIQKTAESYL